MSTDHLLPALRSTQDDQSAAEVGGCIALAPRTQKIPEWDILTGISSYAADRSSADPMALIQIHLLRGLLFCVFFFRFQFIFRFFKTIFFYLPRFHCCDISTQASTQAYGVDRCRVYRIDLFVITNHPFLQLYL